MKKILGEIRESEFSRAGKEFPGLRAGLECGIGIALAKSKVTGNIHGGPLWETIRI